MTDIVTERNHPLYGNKKNARLSGNIGNLKKKKWKQIVKARIQSQRMKYEQNSLRPQDR